MTLPPLVEKPEPALNQQCRVRRAAPREGPHQSGTPRPPPDPTRHYCRAALKAQVVDNTDGIILDHSVRIGNPSDHGLLRPAIDRVHATFGIAPTLVTADRGYWDSTIEADLASAGVATVVIPRTGKASQARAVIEQADAFITAVKWRTGCEGRISHLKRDWAWRRTRLRGHVGARIWCGHGVFAHNLVKINNLRR
jgi:IS5 family transposase